jgi:hypothetical protein
MSEFDVDAFITEIEGLGLRLTAIRFADGTYRVSRWRMLEASEHAQQIEDLWASHIGESKSRTLMFAGRLLTRGSSRKAPEPRAPVTDSTPTEASLLP